MGPIIIKSKFFTKAVSWVVSVYAITLFPFIISSSDMDEFTMNHELIHYEQQKELYLIGFYVLYVYDYIKGVLKYQDKEQAYRNIRFEQEAYLNDNDLGYISKRKRNSWKKYSV